LGRVRSETSKGAIGQFVGKIVVRQPYYLHHFLHYMVYIRVASHPVGQLHGIGTIVPFLALAISSPAITLIKTLRHSLPRLSIGQDTLNKPLGHRAENSILYLDRSFQVVNGKL
jgi:hypothetical protein